MDNARLRVTGNMMQDDTKLGAALDIERYTCLRGTSLVLQQLESDKNTN